MTDINNHGYSLSPVVSPLVICDSYFLITSHVILIYYSVCSLTALEKLYVTGNSRLQTLPDDIGMMKLLKVLDVSNCDLTHLPTR